MDKQDVAPLGGNARWWAMAALSLSLLTVNVDYMVVNVALPEIARDLGADAGEQQWVVNAYILVFAGLLLLGGSVADRYGRKGALMSGLALFVVASAAGAMADSAGQLILSRALMGAGAALIMPTTLSLVRVMFLEPGELARAIGIWAGIAGVGSALGPVIGGLLVDVFGWVGVFWVNVPVLLVTLVAVVRLVPVSRAERARRPDPVGGVLSAGGLALLLWAIVTGAQRGWSDPAVGLTGLGGAVLLAGFVLWELRIAEPMLDVRVFRGTRLTPTVLVISVGFLALGGSIFLLTQYMQFGLGFSALEAGLGILPLAAGLAVGAPLSTRLSARFGVRPIIMLGMALVSAGLAVQAVWAHGSSYLPTGIGLLLSAFGIGLSSALATRVVVSSLPPARAGVASAVNNLTHELSVALGVGVLGSVLVAGYQSRIEGALDRLGLPGLAGDARDNVGAALNSALQLGGTPGAALADAARAALIDAMRVSLWAGAVGAAIGILLALRLPAAAVAAVGRPAGRSADEAPAGRVPGDQPPGDPVLLVSDQHPPRGTGGGSSPSS